ncbi:MAG: hypothetical protein ACFFDW_15590 [Candidatus Thorarchaeota archaeon]
MVKSQSNDWKKVLQIFLEKTFEPLKEKKYQWLVIGSVASVLQKCDLVPNDIDIIVKEPKIVHFVALLLEEYSIEKSKGSPFSDEEIWLSSKKEPVYIGLDQWGFQWVFTRWLIEGMYVEVAHIEPPKGYLEKFDGIWEAGPESWSYIREKPFGKYLVPVIPLEIQLETNFGRGFDERINKIIEIFKDQGYDKFLIDLALNKQHRIKFNQLYLEKEK